MANGSPFSGPIVVEQFAENVKELAFIVAVDVHGRLETYPAIDMYFNPESNLVEFLYSPSMVSEEILLEAEAIAKKVVATFESPGLFAVEMFLTEDGEIWVNEIAPRPHNSGHHSIEGFQTSQFAQLNRILLGLELGPMGLRVPSAMINLVGPSDFSGTYQLEEAQFWESQTDVFVHLYGKTETRPDRKLGHVTVTASNLDSLMLRAREVQARMRIIPS
jgi:5-(carboxyamino)imidazole ribonucleotide synthase